MAFPPSGPTTVTSLGALASYLYQQYNDDEALQAFIDAFNEMAQAHVTWFSTVNLPVYTGLQGDLLDWVAAGLYGLLRPALPSGITVSHGPLNTMMFNTHSFNEQEVHGPANYYLTSDDVFKRILTWHLLKGDGKGFNVRWLKRRIKRFLTGDDGGLGDVAETYQVSVTFGVDHEVNINLQPIRRFARGGAIIGAGAFNSFMFNEFETTSVNFPVSPLVPVFKAAVEAGVLELPFQYTWTVNI